ncbi:hypothetical protein Slin15195_G120090 [Septoria linicola]|uniref:F-box domain-containing protein n=1 Tax=Septoria linicola TaxID=215465 RepID=A0A9Q9B5P6_9PEZI|nr:hypothetical protein Slin15195_G120090 [Septoria linicola]
MSTTDVDEAGAAQVPALSPMSAAARTFAIAELLEAILLQVPSPFDWTGYPQELPNPELPKCRLVSREFRDAIDGSQTLQIRVKRPPHDHTIVRSKQGWSIEVFLLAELNGLNRVELFESTIYKMKLPHMHVVRCKGHTGAIVHVHHEGSICGEWNTYRRYYAGERWSNLHAWANFLISVEFALEVRLKLQSLGSSEWLE